MRNVGPCVACWVPVGCAVLGVHFNRTYPSRRPLQRDRSFRPGIL